MLVLCIGVSEASRSTAGTPSDSRCSGCESHEDADGQQTARWGLPRHRWALDHRLWSPRLDIEVSSRGGVGDVAATIKGWRATDRPLHDAIASKESRVTNSILLGPPREEIQPPQGAAGRCVLGRLVDETHHRTRL